MKVKIKVQRFNAKNPAPYYDSFTVDLPERSTVLDALELIKNEHDRSLTFRRSCRSAICGSCAMIINGRSRLACNTLFTDEILKNGEVVIEPLRNMKLIKDLVVDLTPFWEQFHRVNSWLVPKPERMKDEREWTMVPDEVAKLKDAVFCISCSACFSDCPEREVNPDFLGPAALVKSFRFAFDPRDKLGADRALDAEAAGLWQCTNCYECNVCPKYINPPHASTQLRGRLIERGQIPKSIQDALVNTTRYGNPWGGAEEKRTEWAEGLKVKDFSRGDSAELLLFVGCTDSYDLRNQQVARSMVTVLEKAGVDFAILGNEEKCCGDFAMRSGEAALFEALVQDNLSMFEKYGVRKVVTISPHCFNTLKNDYPAFGGSLEVQHYTQLLSELAEQGVLKLNRRLEKNVCFHDPCFLGRHNRVYEPPRKLLESIPGVKLVEMPRSKENSFCCGGGGGRMWMQETETSGQGRLNVNRAQEAAGINVQVVATACPFCIINLEDGVKSIEKEDTITVKDVAELVAEGLGVAPQP